MKHMSLPDEECKIIFVRVYCTFSINVTDFSSSGESAGQPQFRCEKGNIN